MSQNAVGALTPPVNVRDLIRPGVEANPERSALISVDARWTWRAVERMSDRLAQGLLGLGLEPGDRVASLMPNRPALIVHYLACFKSGLVATPLNYRYTVAGDRSCARGERSTRDLLAHAERERRSRREPPRRVSSPLGRITFEARSERRPTSSFEELDRDRPPGVTRVRDRLAWRRTIRR